MARMKDNLQKLDSNIIFDSLLTLLSKNKASCFSELKNIEYNNLR